MNKLILILLIPVCFLSCNKATFRIDNPSAEAIQVVLDGQNYDIAALSGRDVELKSGLHTLVYNGSTVNFNLITNGGKFDGGIINPTMSNYYIVSVQYGFATPKQSETINYKIAIDGYLVEGPFQKISSLIIDNNKYQCIYGLTSNLPITITSTNPGVVVKSSKYFREIDFIDYLAAEHNLTLEGERDVELDVNLDIKSVKPDISLCTIQFKDPLIDKYVQEANALVKVLLAGGKDSFKAVSKINKIGFKVNAAHLTIKKNTNYSDQDECTKLAEKSLIFTQFDDWIQQFANRSVYIVE